MNARKILGASASAWALAGLLGAQTLVKDINTIPVPMDSNPAFGSLVSAGKVVFAATDADHGRELWVTDGTTAGTTLLKDILPGSVGSSPTKFTLYSSWVFFAAEDGSHGRELWRTDGTAAGTILVADIEPGSGGSDPTDLLWATGKLCFAAQDMRPDVGTGRELWFYSSSGGVSLAADLYPGYGFGGVPRDSDPSELTWFVDANNTARIVFRASGPSMGAELATSDGTPAGTRILADIRPGSGGSSPYGFRRVIDHDYRIPGRDRVFFAANDGVNGVELWSTNGLFSTRLEWNINPGSASSNPRFADQAYYYAANHYVLCLSAASTVYGREPVKLDYTGIRLHDLRAGIDSSITDDAELRAVGRTCYVPADDGVRGTELWRTDGPYSTGFALFQEFTAGAAGTELRGITSADNGPSIFAVVGTGTGARMWFTDGGATRLFVGGTVGARDPYLLLTNQVLYTGATTTPPTGAELRYTNNTGGDRLVKDINPQLPGSSQPFALLTVGTRTFFCAEDPAYGREPWVTDGTTAGTRMLKDIRTGSASSLDPTYGVSFTAFGNRVLFRADDGITGREPWISDGSAAGTYRLRDINPGSASSDARNFAALGPVACFAATDGVNGSELWRTDGTAAGTYMLLDIYTGNLSGGPCNLTVYGGRIYFVGDSPLYGRELWRTDGTVAGTQLLVDLNPGVGLGVSQTAGSVIAVSAAWGSGLLFTGDNGATGYELYYSNGTAAGTSLVRDINPGPTAATPGNYVKVPRANGDQVYFEANDGVSGRELWTRDPLGAVGLVKDANPGSASGMISSLIVGTELGAYWVGTNGTNGYEVWYTDFAGGPNMVKDIAPGAMHSMQPTQSLFCPVGSGNRMVFRADDTVSGPEIWVTNGTTAGTRRLFDMYGGALGSNLQGAVQLGKEVLFAANDEVYGHELWKMPLTTVEAPWVEYLGTGCPGTAGKVPAMSTQGTFPNLGTTLQVAVTNARASAPAAMFLSAAYSPLPVGGGCTLYTNPLLLTLNTATNASGVAAIPVAIPNIPAYLGVELYFEYVVVDPAGAFQGLAALSNALHVLLGRS